MATTDEHDQTVTMADADPGDGADTTGRRELKRSVFFGSSALILAVSVWAIVAPANASTALGAAVSWISHGFGWYYFLAATLILVFVVFLAVSRYGTVKLGPQHSKPNYGLFSWAAMLFAAGIGVDLMFYSVSEPVTQYLAPPTGSPETIEAARQGIVWALFHYGITGWAMYALMGMALGYFAFRYRLPLAIRSALYPIIGKRIHGPIGDGVDLAAIIGTVFGISVSLGIGVVQLNFGLHFLFDLPVGTAVQIALIALAVVISTLSAVTGVDKGIRRLSQLNVLLAILLMAYVFVVDDPVALLNQLVLNIGDYVSRFPGMTLDTFGYDQPTDWLNAWTLFFWAWWVAWAPFVGMFLARISRGRTIRQFVAGTLIVPFLFTLSFLSIFGNAALNVVRGGNAQFGQTTMNTPEQGFYTLLDQYPGVWFSAGLATVVGLLLYVTSADSGALVLGNLSSRLPTPLTDSNPWLRLFWSAATGLLTLGMLLVGGVDALTSATIVMGLPFSFAMFLVMWGLYRALRVERFRQDAVQATLPYSLSERTSDRDGHRGWRQRLARVVSYPGRRAATRFVDDTGRPALREVTDELTAQGVQAELAERPNPETGVAQLELRVPMGGAEDFVYRLWPVEQLTPGYAMPVTERDRYMRIEVYLADGSQGYDVLGYGKDQLIGDVLDQYERHVEFLRLHGTTNEATVLPAREPVVDDSHTASSTSE